MRRLNDRFSEYELAKDEDFVHRLRVLLTGNEGKQLSDVLPRSSLNWELDMPRSGNGCRSVITGQIPSGAIPRSRHAYTSLSSIGSLATPIPVENRQQDRGVPG